MQKICHATAIISQLGSKPPLSLPLNNLLPFLYQGQILPNIMPSNKDTPITGRIKQLFNAPYLLTNPPPTQSESSSYQLSPTWVKAKSQRTQYAQAMVVVPTSIIVSISRYDIKVYQLPVPGTVLFFM